MPHRSLNLTLSRTRTRTRSSIVASGGGHTRTNAQLSNITPARLSTRQCANRSPPHLFPVASALVFINQQSSRGSISKMCPSFAPHLQISGFRPVTSQYVRRSLDRWRKKKVGQIAAAETFRDIPIPMTLSNARHSNMRMSCTSSPPVSFCHMGFPSPHGTWWPLQLSATASAIHPAGKAKSMPSVMHATRRHTAVAKHVGKPI